jgi:hypothetical protein
MRNLSQLTTRRAQLYLLLDEAEAVVNCKSSNHSHQEKKAAKKAAVTLSCIIQEFEWAMGMREETFVDKLVHHGHFSDFSDN